jgi:N-acetylneuraminic acid mutarotase
LNKIIQTLAVVLLASFSVTTFFVPSANAAEDSWKTMEPMPTARNGLGVAVVNGKIYAIGGFTSNYLGTNEMYDPETDTWTTKASMPNPRCKFAIAVVENKIYVIGGANLNGFSSVNQVYDPATDTWETLTQMSRSRAELCANVIDGKIYVIGGSFLHYWPAPTNLTEVYDPKTDTWTTKAEMPTAVYGCTSAVVDDKIYVIENGRSVTVACVNQIYDTETDSWSIGQPLPTRAVGAAAVATTGVYAPKLIYVIGGGDLFTYDINQIYDTETDTWTNGTAMPTPRQRLGVAVLNDTLYAIGGYQIDSDAVVNSNERYTPEDYIPEFPLWLILPLFLMATFSAIIVKKMLLHQRS